MFRSAVVLCALVLGESAWARTVVTVDTGDDLQAVIDTWQGSSEVVIYLTPGTHSDCITITADIDVVGEGEDTILECSSGDAVIDVSAGATALIHGMVIRHDGGLGVQISENANVTLDRVDLSGMGSQTSFGAISVSTATLNVLNSEFRNNEGSNAGAIQATDSSLYVFHSEFSGNAGGNGGAISAINSGVSIDSSTFTDNTATGFGGAVYVYAEANGPSFNSARSVFDHNIGTMGAGAVAAVTVGLYSERNVYENNESSDVGGAVFASGVIYSYFDTYTTNRAPRGGGLYSDNQIYMAFTTLEGNRARSLDTAGGTGGAIWLSGSLLYLVGNQFTDNQTTDNAGTIKGGGGAVYAAGHLQSYANTYLQNQASAGGALYLVSSEDSEDNDSVYTDNTAVGTGVNGGGAIRWDSSHIIYIRQGIFEDNQAALNGGAIYGDKGTLEISDSRFTANATGNSGFGGAILASSTTTLRSSHTEFSENSSGKGGAIAIRNSGAATTMLSLVGGRIFDNAGNTQGGALYLQSGTQEIDGVLFYGNYGGASGAGAVYSENTNALNLQNSLFCLNTTTGSGGAIYLKNPMGNRFIQQTAFVENEAANKAGSVYEYGHGDANVTYWKRNTFVGNGVTGGSFESNLVGESTPYSSIVDSVFVSNGYSAIASIGAPSHGYAGVVAHDHTSPAYNESNSWGSDYNVIDDPFLTNWVPASNPADPAIDCFDDDLRPQQSFSSYEGMGVGVSATSGTQPTLDQDSDGYTVLQGDCNDNDPAMNPGQVEISNDPDGVNEDCYVGPQNDADEDGFPYNYDCNDADPTAYPRAPEVNYGPELNCIDGDQHDLDKDGWWGTEGSDCDDLNAAISPNAFEDPFNGIDDNCDGLIDDLDGDGFGSNIDCDETRDDVYPDALTPDDPEDGVEYDCSENEDNDGDGYYASNDCDDGEPTIHPGAEEIPDDGIDQDCDDEDLVTLGDSDEDGISDAWENAAGSDPDSADSDDDGYSDRWEWALDGSVTATPLDSDGDSTPDVIDTDSDDDSVMDAVEEGDSDDDGDEDRMDTDDDGDGIPTLAEGVADLDEDDVPNYLDTDSDNDGSADAAEGDDDADGDGTPDYLDDDHHEERPGPPGPPDKIGFGCDSSTTPLSLGLTALAGLVMRRRRQNHG